MERRYFRACAEHLHDLGFDDDPPRSKGRQLVPIRQYLARTRIMRDPTALKLALPGPAWPGQSGGPEQVLQVALAAASAARVDAAKPWLGVALVSLGATVALRPTVVAPPIVMCRQQDGARVAPLLYLALPRSFVCLPEFRRNFTAKILQGLG